MRIVCLALALLSSFACGGERPGNVLLITVDTLRADHVGAYGYERDTTPHLDRFFRDGRIHLRSYATSSYTPPSVVSILSGLLPQEHGVRRFLDLYDGRAPLLCDLLAGSFETAAFVSNAVLTDEALGIGSCFDHYDDYVDEREGPVRKVFERRAARTTNAALAWLESGRDPARRSLVWVHYIDPHGPYQPPDDADVGFDHAGTQPFDVRKMPLYAHAGTDDGLEFIDRYDEEIAYADREIGRLLAGWADRSDVDRDLVIFTSDHGESLLGRSRYFDHGFQVWEDQIRIPMMIRAPGFAPARIDEPTSLLDVLPTILAFAGIDAPAGLLGVDLLGDPLDPERMVYAEAHQWITVVQGTQKWTARFARGRPQLRETHRYDLVADPLEERPGRWTPDAPAATWLRALARADPTRRAGGPFAKPGGKLLDEPKVAPGATEEQLEQLRGLGYIE